MAQAIRPGSEVAQTWPRLGQTRLRLGLDSAQSSAKTWFRHVSKIAQIKTRLDSAQSQLSLGSVLAQSRLRLDSDSARTCLILGSDSAQSRLILKSDSA